MFSVGEFLLKLARSADKGLVVVFPYVTRKKYGEEGLIEI